MEQNLRKISLTSCAEKRSEPPGEGQHVYTSVCFERVYVATDDLESEEIMTQDLFASNLICSESGKFVSGVRAVRLVSLELLGDVTSLPKRDDSVVGVLWNAIRGEDDDRSSTPCCEILVKKEPALAFACMPVYSLQPYDCDACTNFWFDPTEFGLTVCRISAPKGARIRCVLDYAIDLRVGPYVKLDVPSYPGEVGNWYGVPLDISGARKLVPLIGHQIPSRCIGASTTMHVLVRYPLDQTGHSKCLEIAFAMAAPLCGVISGTFSKMMSAGVRQAVSCGDQRQIKQAVGAVTVICDDCRRIHVGKRGRPNGGGTCDCHHRGGAELK